MTAEPILVEHVATVWERDVLPALLEYMTIPDVSPTFDADWASHGHIAQAAELLRAWAAGRPIDGATVELVELDDRTPLLVVEVPASAGCAHAD